MQRQNRRGLRARQRLSRRLQSERLESRDLLAADDWGVESLLNQPTQGNQVSAPQGQSTAILPAGDGLVAYSGNGPGDSGGVFVRSVDVGGVPLGDAIWVNQTRDGQQKYAAVAAASDGSAIVAWSGKGNGDNHGIFARRLAADGTFLTDEFRVNQTKAGGQWHPVIAPLENGEFVVVWTGNGTDDYFGVFARQFDSSGSPITDETRVNPIRAGIQGSPQVAALPGGGYAIAWSGTAIDDWLGVYVRRYDADGRATTDVTRVNPSTTGYQGSPDLAVLPGGELVVAWSGRGAGDFSGVYVRQFDTNNNPTSPAVLVNTTTSRLQYGPTIATSDDGSFLVLWNEFVAGGNGTEIKGRHFQSITSPVNAEFILPVTRSGSQTHPSLAADGSGGYLASWTRQDNHDKDVYVRRLASAGDIMPPEVSLQLGNDTGLSSSDQVTSDLSLIGTILDGSSITSVTLSVNDDSPIDVSGSLDDTSGVFSISDGELRSLASNVVVDGQVTIRVTATDAFGNVAFSDPLVVTLDASAPPAPAILSIDEDTGFSATDEITSDSTVTLIGTAEPSSTVVVSESTIGVLGTVSADADGHWTFDFDATARGDDGYRFSAIATDAAGNDSDSSANLPLVIDTTPPTAPVVVSVEDINGNPIPGGIVSGSAVVIRGTAGAGTGVAIYASALGYAETTSVDFSGQWAITIDLDSLVGNAFQFVLQATDLAGNLSAFSDPVDVAREATPPVDIQVQLAAESDSGSAGDNTTYFDLVQLVGVTDPYAEVVLQPGGATTAAAADGTFTFADVSLVVGLNRFTVESTDQIGNTQTASLSIQHEELIDAIILTESPGSLFSQATELVELGQRSGSRVVRMRVDATFDTSGNATLEDTFLVSLVDPNETDTTLLDRGENGTSLFMLSGSDANFATGLVQYDGQFLEIDVTSLSALGEGLLVFQLVSTDADTGTEIAISEITSTVDPLGTERLAADFRQPIRPSGGPIDLGGLTLNEDVQASIQNLHVDDAGERFFADIQLQNFGDLVGSDAVVVVRGLPGGISVVGSSGLDSAGDPYLSFADIIDPIGLDAGILTDRIRLEISDPGLQPFELTADVLTRTLSADPILFDPVGNMVVAAGELASVSLSASDPDGRDVLYSLVSDGPTPTLRFDSSGSLTVRPQPTEAGTYQIGLVASVGSKSTRQDITLTVTADVAATTRISGTVLDVDGTPLSGLPVVLGRVSANTDSEGRFTIELPSTLLPTEEFDIVVPAGDVFFDPFNTGIETIDFRRARFDTTTGTDTANPRRHRNLVTSFLDGSVLYGSDDDRATALRTLSGGRLKTQAGVDGELLPYNSTDFFPSGPLENDSAGPVDPASLFVAGDVRSSENPMLASLHTILVREHNRLADEILAANPALTDEQIFQRARKMVGAMLQHITYNEYLPLLLGEGSLSSYTGYDAAANPAVGAFFTTVAFRIGHSQSPDEFDLLDSGGGQILGAPLSSQHASFNTSPIVQFGVDPILRGMLRQPIEAVDLQVGDSLRNMLFGPPGSGGLDLPSLSIQRARDLGLPSYNEARIEFGLAPMSSFDEISTDPGSVARLEAAYGSIDEIDAFVGGLAEDHLAGAMVGPLFHAAIKAQFENARASDRFWYENAQFNADDLATIRATTMADLIQRNSGLSGLTGNLFSTTVNPTGPSPGGASTADSAVTFRAIDGAGNNSADPQAGATGSWLHHDTGQYYADGISEPNGADRPSARAISNAALNQTESALASNGANTLAVFWGQLIAHELSLTPTGTSDTLRFLGDKVDVPGASYPYVAEKINALLGRDLYEGMNNEIGRPIYLPKLDLANADPVNPTGDTIVDTAAIPGLKVVIPAGSTTTREGDAFTGAFSITEVPRDLAPISLPESIRPDLLMTIQPAELSFDEPVAITIPNRGGNLPGSFADLVAINPATGQFEVVGRMQVSEDGSVLETIQGGLRTTNWFLADNNPTVDGEESEAQNEDACACEGETEFISSEVQLFTGALLEEHTTAAYQSLDRPRSLTLKYDSMRADPRHIVRFGANRNFGALQPVMGARLEFSSGNQTIIPPQEELVSSAGDSLVGSFWQSDAVNADLGVQVDFSNLPTDVFDWNVDLGLFDVGDGQWSGNWNTNATSGRVVHVNETASPFGVGWTLENWSRVVETGSSDALVVRGDGTQILFERQADGSYKAPPIVFDTLTKEPDGSFQLRTKSQTVYQFGNHGQQTTMTDRVGNQTEFAYDANGMVQSYQDEAGLTTHFLYNATADRIAKIVDPAGRTTLLQHDAQGNLQAITDPDNSQRNFLWNTRSNMVGEVDQLGRIERTFYGSEGRVAAAVQKTGERVFVNPVQSKAVKFLEARRTNFQPGLTSLADVTQNRYEPIARFADRIGRLTEKKLTPIGFLRDGSDDLGQTGRNLRNSQNLVSHATDADGHTDRYEYDDRGNVISIRDALNGGNRVDGQIDIPGQKKRFSFTITDETTLLFDPLTPDPFFTWSLDGPQGTLVDVQSFDIGIFDTSQPGIRVIPGDYLLTVDALEGFTGDFMFRLFDLSAAPLMPVGVETVVTLDPDNHAVIYQLDAKLGQDYFIEFADINDAPDVQIIGFNGRSATGGLGRSLSIAERIQNSLTPPIAISFGCPFDLDLLAEGETKPPQSYPIVVHAVDDEVRPLALGESNEMSFDAPTETATYEFELQTNSRVSIAVPLQSEGIHATVLGPRGAIFDTEAERLDAGQFGSVPDFGSRDVHLETGRYALKIAGVDLGKPSFSVALADAGPDEVSVFSSGPAFGAATVIGLEQFVSGPIDGSGQIQYFDFTLDRREVVYISGASDLPGLAWSLEGPGLTIDVDADGNPLTLASSYVGNESTEAYALERGDYRFALTPSTANIGNYEFTVIGLASNPISSNTNVNVPLGGSIQAAALMLRTEADESWTVNVDSVLGIDPGDAVVRIIDSTGRDALPGFLWSDEYLHYESTYDGETYLLIGSRTPITSGSSITLAASPVAPRLLPINLNQTISETLTAIAPLNAHSFTVDVETLVAIDVDMGSPDIEWTLFDSFGQLIEAAFLEEFSGGLGGGIGGGGVGGGIGGGGSGAVPPAVPQPFALLPAGDYTLEVSQFGFDTVGYSLSITNVATASLLDSAQSETLTLTDAVRSAYRGIILNQNQEIVVDVTQFVGLPPEASLQVVNPSGNNVAHYPLDEMPQRITVNQAGRYTVVVDQGIYYDPVFATPSLTVSIVSDNVTAMPFGSLQSGSIESPYQTESFSFAGFAGQAVLLQHLAAATPPADLTIIGPGGSTVATSTAGAEVTEPIVLTQDGTYQIQAGGNGTSGDFRFRLLNLTAVNSLSAGLPRTGQLSEPAASNAYRIPASVGQRFQVSISAGNDASLRRRVFSAAGILLADSAAGQDAFTANHAADFYVVVDAPGATLADDLSYAIVADDVTAGPVTDSGYDAPFSGSITVGAIDEYTFTASAGVAVRLRETDFDASVLQSELISPSGESIDLSKMFSFPISGDYTLRIQGVLASDVGSYELSLDRTDQIVTDAVFGERTTGSISNGQAVVQQLTLTASQRIALDGGGDDVSASRLRIYDPHLNVVFDGAGNDDFQFSTPVSGTYLLVVDSATASTVAYSFRLLNFSDATNIIPGLPVTTTLDDGNDLETFRFTAAAGQRLYVDGGVSRFESWTLYDPLMNEVFSRPADVSGGLGELELALNLSGNYTLAFDSSRTTSPTFTFATYLSDVGEPIEINPYASGSGMTITYDPVFNVPTEIVDDLGRITRFVIDPNNGNVLSATRIFGADDEISGETDDLTTTYTYTPFGLVDTMTDPLGRITDHNYDAEGKVTRTTSALGTPDESTMSYEYDAAGNVSATIDAIGNRTEYEYDELNRLVVTRNAILDEIQFTYDDRGNRLTYTNERGHTWTYAYDKLDRIETITDPLDQIQRYTYDDIGNVIRYTDKLGRVTRFAYDARNRLLSRTAADGGVTRWTYDGNDNVATIADPLGRVSQFFYDARDQETAMVDADGNRTSYRYDSAGNQISVTDPLGRITRSRYDELDRLTQVDYFAADIVGHTTKFDYDRASNLVELVDPLGRITRNAFDNLDRLTSQTRAFGTIDVSNTSFEYDPQGNLIATVDANNNRSEFEYDPLNRVEVDRDALNQEMIYRHDPSGNVISVTDRRGFVTEYAFDELNRPVTMTDALNFEWTTQYDAVDNVLARIDPLGRTDAFTYDSVNRLLTTTDSVGNVTSNAYDIAGNVRTKADARGNVTTYDYDPLDRVKTVLDAEGNLTTFQYDAVNNLLQTTDALGRLTQYDYDGLDRVNQKRWITGASTGGPGEIDEDVTVTNYAYDLTGNLLALTDGLGNQTTWTYDNLNRQLTMTDPLSRTESYVYDPLGLVTELTDRGGYVTAFGYDALNRLESETWIDGHSAYGGTGDFVITYGYDPESNLTSVSDPLSSLTFTIDPLNRVETEGNAGTLNVPRVDLTFTYDEIGNRTSVTERIRGVAGAVTASSYDDADRVQSITQSLADGGVVGTVSDKRVDFTYNPVNQFESILRYGDLTNADPIIATTQAYDAVNRLTDLRHANVGGTDVAFYTFDYDEEDRLTRIIDIRGAIDYAYDGRGQLTAADYSDARSNERYDFDQNGNRLVSSRHAGTYQTGDNNRLMSDGRYTYDYNDRGDMILRTDAQTGEAREFSWDHRGRLAGVDDLTKLGIISQSVAYTYDGFDRRITRSVDADGTGPGPAVTESFVYDRDDVLLDFVDGDLAARYLHGPATDQVLAREDFTQTSAEQVDEVYWHLHDHLGSTREIADSTGTVVNQITLDVFGYVVDQTDPGVSTRYLFTGREYDGTTGLYYYRARYYDPATGRFISEDPIGFAAGDANLYRYVANAPMSARDPDGLETVGFQRVPSGYAGQAGAVVSAGFYKAASVAGAGTRGIGQGLGNAATSAYSAIDFAGKAVAMTATHNYANVSDGLETLTGLELAGSDYARQRSEALYAENFATADHAVRDFVNMTAEQRVALLKDIAESIVDSAKSKARSLYNKAVNGCYEGLAEELGEMFGEALPELIIGAKGAGHIRKIDFDSIKRAVIESGKGKADSLPLDKATRDAIKRGDVVQGASEDILVLGRGDPNILSGPAEAVGGRVIDNPAIKDNPRALWKHIYGEMRRADKIVQVVDDIPAHQVAGRGSGEWARAEKVFIDNSEVLRTKRTFVRRTDLGL